MGGETGSSWPDRAKFLALKSPVLLETHLCSAMETLTVISTWHHPYALNTPSSAITENYPLILMFSSLGEEIHERGISKAEEETKTILCVKGFPPTSLPFLSQSCATYVCQRTMQQ